MNEEVPPQAKLIAAQQRSMPMTRLLDCGMDYADAVQLFARTSAGEPWDKVAEGLAKERLRLSAEADADGRHITASEHLTRAIAALVFAQMAFNFDVPRKRQLYRDLVAACRKLTEIYDFPVTRLEVPFAGANLIGWLVRPATLPARGTVVMFGGQSGWGVAYLPAARALAKRGLATLLAEGPGQGETRLAQGIHLDVDVPAAYNAFVARILADSSLGQPGIWGNSFGGLWAAQAAARNAHIRACCVNGSFASPRVLPFRTALEQSAAMLGTEDEAAIARNFARLRLDPERERIRCPLLALHGGADPMVTLEDQQPFLDATDTADKALKIWPDGDHTIYNHGHERTALVADWFAARLTAR